MKMKSLITRMPPSPPFGPVSPRPMPVSEFVSAGELRLRRPYPTFVRYVQYCAR